MVLANSGFELLECTCLRIELPPKIGTHLSFHLVDLPKCKHTLVDDAPASVRMCVIVNDLGGNHDHGDEEVASRGTASGNEPSLQSLQ